MTQLNPALIINKLMVKKTNKVVYSQVFHKGLNVLYGSNGGGKTSVIQLLVYSLGYDVKEWKVEAGSCDVVYSEIEINGEILTFRRYLPDGNLPGLQICYMNLEDSLLAGIDNWKEYPYKISANKESFSQKIFELMDFPETRFDQSSNMTMHQILRLIYSDQSNPARYIFNNEQWDSGLKREIIGNYLLGLHDTDLYSAKIEMNNLEKNHDKLVSEINAINRILYKSTFISNIGSIENEIVVLKNENEGILVEIEKIKNEQVVDCKKESKVSGELMSENLELKSKTFTLEQDIGIMNYEIQDSKEFIDELENKYKAIEDSIRVKSVIANIPFDICPSCFAKLENKTIDDGKCNLCGNEQKSSNNNVNLLRMKNEIKLQLDESKIMLKAKQNKCIVLTEELRAQKRKLRSNFKKIAPIMTSINVARENSLFSYYQKMGENDEKMENYIRFKSLISELQDLHKQNEQAAKDIEEYKRIILEKEELAHDREVELKTEISTIMCNLLTKDTIAESNEELEDKFKNATKVDFDFAANAIIVDSQSIFSESSMYLLNNLFHFSLLVSSTKHQYMRFPRLLILDGIENGGMSDARSRNFQKIIKDVCDALDVNFQVIIATRSIHSELLDSSYQLGEKFTSTKKSLDFNEK